jgi:hypothetical protein
MVEGYLIRKPDATVIFGILCLVELRVELIEEYESEDRFAGRIVSNKSFISGR